MANLDRIDAYLVSMGQYIPQSKRVKLRSKGTIFDPLIRDSETLPISELLDFKNFNDDVMEFHLNLDNNFSKHCDLSSFYRNLRTLRIDVRENIHPNYNPDYNVITYDQDKRRLFHQLLHLAANKGSNIDRTFVGFRQYGIFYDIGKGLNDSYTEYLNKKYFFPEDGNPIQDDTIEFLNPDGRVIAYEIEKLVGEDVMEKLYFSGDLNGLLHHLGRYTSFEHARSIVAKMDYLQERPVNSDGYQELLEDIRYNVGKIHMAKIIHEHANRDLSTEEFNEESEKIKDFIRGKVTYDEEPKCSTKVFSKSDSNK